MINNWYDTDKKTVLKTQNTDEHSGLSEKEVAERLTKFGANKFAEKKKEPLWLQILRQLKDVAVIVLLIAAGLSFALALKEGEGFIEPIVILAIVIMNTVLAITQERGAERALEALSLLNSPTCIVLRNGTKQEIDTTLLVPGDIIILKTGNLVPADARLLESESFAVDESSLTGESEPSSKTDDLVLASGIPLGDRKNMVFSGCLVVTGHAKAVVTDTGMTTQIGKIAGHLQHTKKNKTPLQARLDKLGKMISGIAVASAFVLLMVGLIQGEEPWHLILLAVTLAVAAVPETLMLIVTLMLTHGVKKMVEKNALIRKLQAVETLGSTSVICSDKTGTLTQNKMTIKRLWIYGSQPISDTSVFGDEQLWFTKRLLLSSNVTAERGDNGEMSFVGDPTETAIMRLCIEKGLNKNALSEEFQRVAEIPFSSSRKMMTVVVKKPDGKYLVLTKGAFDRIPFIKKDQNYIKELEDVHNAFASDALRVITLASKEIDTLPPKSELETLESNLTFEGFIGIIDPPRPEAAAAIARAKGAGIRTIMITGDHAATATAIARELGIIAAKEGIITGQELAKLSDEELFNSIEYYSVYARVTPEDKIRIVQAWQRYGDVVSMTGDGVNDAPALKAADVGVAMGINGTEVAKSAADMVLTDDKFSTIVDAVTEGRNVFSNIRKLIYFLIVCNISEVIIMLFGQISGWGLPVSPIMLLLVNVLGDGIPGIALAKEKSDPRIMNRKPIERNESFFSGGLMEVIIRQTVICSIVVLAAFYIGKFVDITNGWNLYHVGGWGDFDENLVHQDIGQTMAFLVLGWSSILHIFTVRSRQSVFRRSLKDNPQLIFSALAMFVIFGALAAIPALNEALGLCNMSIFHWLLAFGLSLLPTLIAEYQKFWDNYKLRSVEKNRVALKKIDN